MPASGEAFQALSQPWECGDKPKRGHQHHRATDLQQRCRGDQRCRLDDLAGIQVIVGPGWGERGTGKAVSKGGSSVGCLWAERKGSSASCLRCLLLVARQNLAIRKKKFVWLLAAKDLHSALRATLNDLWGEIFLACKCFRLLFSREAFTSPRHF